MNAYRSSDVLTASDFTRSRTRPVFTLGRTLALALAVASVTALPVHLDPHTLLPAFSEARADSDGGDSDGAGHSDSGHGESSHGDSSHGGHSSGNGGDDSGHGDDSSGNGGDDSGHGDDDSGRSRGSHDGDDDGHVRSGDVDALAAH